MVTISTPGVEGDMDRFRLVMESERGDMPLVLCEGVGGDHGGDGPGLGGWSG